MSSGTGATLPKITVATICFNAVKTIGNSLRSLQEQTYPNLEFIVMDGDSTDGTLDIIDVYGGLAPLVFSEPDEGPNHAFQKAIDAATGDLFLLLNADDLLEPGALIAIGEAWRANPTDIVTLPVRTVIEKREGATPTLATLRTYHADEMAPTIKNISGGKIFPNARACRLAFLRQERIRHLLPDGKKSIAADMDLYLRLVTHPFTNQFLAGAPAYLYRHHDDSLTFNSNPEKLRKIVQETGFILRRFLSEATSLSLPQKLQILKSLLRLKIYDLKLAFVSRTVQQANRWN